MNFFEMIDVDLNCHTKFLELWNDKKNLKNLIPSNLHGFCIELTLALSSCIAERNQTNLKKILDLIILIFQNPSPYNQGVEQSDTENDLKLKILTQDGFEGVPCLIGRAAQDKEIYKAFLFQTYNTKPKGLCGRFLFSIFTAWYGIGPEWAKVNFKLDYKKTNVHGVLCKGGPSPISKVMPTFTGYFKTNSSETPADCCSGDKRLLITVLAQVVRFPKDQNSVAHCGPSSILYTFGNCFIFSLYQASIYSTTGLT